MTRTTGGSFSCEKFGQKNGLSVQRPSVVIVLERLLLKQCLISYLSKFSHCYQYSICQIRQEKKLEQPYQENQSPTIYHLYHFSPRWRYTLARRLAPRLQMQRRVILRNKTQEGPTHQLQLIQELVCNIMDTI